MAAESKSYPQLSFRNVVIVLLVLIGLFLLSLWAARKSSEVRGPSRLVKGPHDTIALEIDRTIAQVSADGQLLSVIDLDSDAAVPDVGDFFVQADGRLLLARQCSRLELYSPGGNLSTLLRLPPPADGSNFCGMAVDPSTGIVYFADTFRDRIRMFGPDQREAKIITVPSGTQASSSVGDESGHSDHDRVYSPETPLRSPLGLSFAGDRLIAADTGNSRLVLFYPDGSLDKIVPVFPLDSSNFMRPVRVDRAEDKIYAVVRGPGMSGEVQSFELNTGLPLKFTYSGASEPRDVLARRDDVLVADRASLSVLRYAHSGRFLGSFGKPGLEDLYAGSQFRRKKYEWIRKGSLAGMGAVFGWLLFAAGRRPGYRPVAALQKILGSPRSIRRKLLLLIPGLGQAAAGRAVRAGISLLLLLYFVLLFTYSWLRYRSPAGTQLSLQILITAGFLAYSAWIAVVLDGLRLDAAAEREDPAVAKRGRQAALAAVIMLCSAIIAQLTRELIVYGYPEAPSVIQQVFHFLMASTNAHSSLAAAARSASVVFGWGGAAAALFGTFAWQVKAHRSEAASATVAGFLAGVYSWLITAVLAGTRPGWLLYAPALQGFVLALFTWLYFRRKGMPLLIIPVSVAGAWIGNFLRFLFGDLAGPIRNLLSQGDAGALWTGSFARMELVLVPVLFIHLSIWITWLIASLKSAEDVKAMEDSLPAFSSARTKSISEHVRDKASAA